LAAAASTVLAASAVARYTDHASGIPESGCWAMHPATRTPSLVKLK